MAKFKVLKTNQTLLSRVGIYLDRSIPSTNVSLFLCTHYTPVAIFIAFTISIAFVFKNPSEIELCLRALEVCTGAIQLTGIFFGFKMQVNKMNALQSELQKIVNKGITILHFLNYFSCSWFHSKLKVNVDISVYALLCIGDTKRISSRAITV